MLRSLLSLFSQRVLISPMVNVDGSHNLMTSGEGGRLGDGTQLKEVGVVSCL